RAYEAAKKQIDEQTRGHLKVHRDKAVRTLQILFLFHIARTRQLGLIPEEIANSVLIEREPNATPDENIQHYETIAVNLGKELPQIVEAADSEAHARFRFEPVVVGLVDPQREFRRVRGEAESSEVMQREAWEQLLGLDV